MSSSPGKLERTQRDFPYETWRGKLADFLTWFPSKYQKHPPSSKPLSSTKGFVDKMSQPSRHFSSVKRSDVLPCFFEEEINKKAEDDFYSKKLMVSELFMKISAVPGFKKRSFGPFIKKEVSFPANDAIKACLLPKSNFLKATQRKKDGISERKETKSPAYKDLFEKRNFQRIIEEKTRESFQSPKSLSFGKKSQSALSKELLVEFKRNKSKRNSEKETLEPRAKMESGRTLSQKTRSLRNQRHCFSNYMLTSEKQGPKAKIKNKLSDSSGIDQSNWTPKRRSAQNWRVLSKHHLNEENQKSRTKGGFYFERLGSMPDLFKEKGLVLRPVTMKQKK